MDVFESMIIEFDLLKNQLRELNLEEFAIDAQEHKIYWIHVNLQQKKYLQLIAEKLQLPSNVIEACHVEDTIQTVLDDEASLSIQIECVVSTNLEMESEIEFKKLMIYLTPRFCFTAANVEIPALKLFRKNCQKALPYAKTSCFILFLLLDNIINDYSKVLLDFELSSHQIDLKVRGMPEQLYNEVMNIKKQATKTKYYISTIRDTLMRISARSIPVISPKCQHSLRNLFNNSQIIFMQIDSIRAILNSVLDQIDNALMQNISKSMKILTAITAIFLPLSLIAGIYGMNFYIPEQHWKYGYFGALGLMVLCGLLLVYIFKKKKWF